jgi:hypothetical protein
MKSSNAMDFEVVNLFQNSSAAPLCRDEHDPLEGVRLKREWGPEVAAAMKKRRIPALEANYAWGWKNDGCEFLREVPWLRGLVLIAGTIEDLSPVSELLDLERLKLSCHSRRSLDFSGLKRLQSCSINWLPGGESVFRCEGLESLYLDGVKGAQLAGISELKSLKKLTIANSNLNSLAVLDGLCQLEKLELLNCRKLTLLDGLECFQRIKWLSIDGSKPIQDFRAVSELPDLEVLNLSGSGKIKSLAFLRPLKKLRAFSFAGSTTSVEDGDLSPLEDLPELSMLMFGPRKHYTHRLVKGWSWSHFSTPDQLLEKKT